MQATKPATPTPDSRSLRAPDNALLHRRRAALSALGTLSALTLAACGGGGDSSTTTASGSSDASIMGLSLSVGTLVPAFAPATLAYTTSVAYATTSISFTPTLSDTNATLRIGSTVVSSGQTSGAFTLTVGNNSFSLTVTAQDGSARTYSLVVARASANVSAEAQLLALSISTGILAPGFSSALTSYAVSLASTVSAVTLSCTASAGATIKVNGSAISNGGTSGALALNVGSNTLTVEVTAEDGVTTRSTTVTATRVSTSVSSNATLTALGISAGNLSPAFASGTVSYTASVPNATASLTLTPTAADPVATIMVQGVAVSSGAASPALALGVGLTTLTVVVSASDGTTTSTYTVAVTRAAEATNVATLSTLATSSGTLVPTFTPETTNYTVAVANAVTSLALTLSATSSRATVQVNGTAVTSGGTTAAQALSVGSNTLSVVVTAQDGSTSRTYTVIATRASVESVICPAGVVPEETAGPYPADGSTASNNSYNVLGLSGIVRSDIRYTLGSSTPVSGVPLTIQITLVNLNANCAPLSGYAIYLWHCTPSGVYSVYNENSVASNYLRGVQATSSSGTVAFTTVVPGCYSGRMPHAHFEIYRSLAQATSASNKIRTSQLAFPTATMQAIYAAASGYANSVANLANISFATDNVFSDGYALEMVTMTGDATAGYTASVTVAIAV